jgi:hypothetical protein
MDRLSEGQKRVLAAREPLAMSPLKRRQKKTAMNECAFCGPTSEPLTIEDVMPRWLSKFFRRTYNNQTFKQQGVHRGQPASDPEMNQRIRVDVPVVCRACNQGWMSQLEDHAKPILTPLITHPKTPRSISAVDCLTLASWLSAKSVVLDFFIFHRGQQRALFYTPRQRHELRDANIPPSLATVWIGRMQKRGLVSGDIQTLYYSKLKSDPAFRNLRATVTTVAVNEVVIQLVAWRKMSKTATVPDPIPWFHSPSVGPWDEYMIEVWPALPESVEWPPSLMFRRGNFNLLAYRLVGIPPPL